MRPADNVEDVIRKKMNFAASTKLHDRMLDDVLNAQEKSQKTESAFALPKIRRTIMKNPITKLAAAAVVTTVVALGLFEFIGTGSTSGVVWAEVAKKVQASRGTISRSIDTSSDSRDDGPDYTMNYLCSTQSRHDSYKGDQIVKTFYDDYNTKTVILVDHGHKSFCKMTFEKMGPNQLLADPKSMVQRFLSHEYRELGRKTVEGVLCEGFETTDPAFDESDSTDSLLAKIWVNVETGYPVKFEAEIVRNNGEIRIGGVADQFQWDVELDERMFEPDIPVDYIDISPGE